MKLMLRGQGKDDKCEMVKFEMPSFFCVYAESMQLNMVHVQSAESKVCVEYSPC